jgi:hypothetical protein
MIRSKGLAVCARTSLGATALSRPAILCKTSSKSFWLIRGQFGNGTSSAAAPTKRNDRVSLRELVLRIGLYLEIQLTLHSGTDWVLHRQAEGYWSIGTSICRDARSIGKAAEASAQVPY